MRIDSVLVVNRRCQPFLIQRCRQWLRPTLRWQIENWVVAICFYPAGSAIACDQSLTSRAIVEANG